MKRCLALVLAAVLLLVSLAGCSGDELIGTWKSVGEEGQQGVLVFNKNGTGSIGIDGIDFDTKWSVMDDKYLTVSIEVSGREHKAFDGVEFSVDGDTLRIVNDGEEAIFKRG